MIVGEKFEAILEKARSEYSSCECCITEAESHYLYVIEKDGTTAYFHICTRCSTLPSNHDVDYPYRMIQKFTKY